MLTVSVWSTSVEGFRTHFEANSDTNFRRKHSYIRPYQMVALLQNFAGEQEENQKARDHQIVPLQNIRFCSLTADILR